MSFIEKNANLGAPLKLSPWRKIAIGSWRTAKDPSVYAAIDLDVQKALNYIADLNKNSGEVKVTITHFLGKALANCFAKHPAINCILRMGRLYPRKAVDIFFQVATDMKGIDLSGVTIRDAEKKTVLEIAKEMQDAVTQVRFDGDPTYKKSKNIMGSLPTFLVGCLLDLFGFLLYGLNIWSPIFGTPRDAFGSMMITNVGTLGLGLSFAPLVAYSRVPALISLSTIEEKPVVKEGNIVIAPILQIGITVDHRVIDGAHGGNMVRTLRTYFEDPSTL